MDTEYRLRIADSYTPATLPMERLAEYLATFARLLGEIDYVHFDRISEGSTVLRAKVDLPARPKVRDRVRGVRMGTAPQDAIKAFSDLDEMLRRDNATGAVFGENDDLVIPLPGRDRPEPIVFGPFRQDGSVYGQLIRIGGRDETVPVHLRDGEIIHTGLHTTPAIARRMAPHLLGPVLRVHGSGLWFRSQDGAWELRTFRIEGFEVLEDTALSDVVDQLRAVGGSTWHDEHDPVATLLRERSGEGSLP